MRFLIQFGTLIFGLMVVAQVVVLKIENIDQSTLNLYLVSTGRSINHVYYVDSTGLSEMPVSLPPGISGSPQQIAMAFSMNVEILVPNQEDGSVSRVSIPLINTPRGIQHISALPIYMQPLPSTHRLNSYPHYRGILAGIGAACIGGSVMIVGIRTFWPQWAGFTLLVESSHLA